MKKFESILVDILFILAVVILCIINYDSLLFHVLAGIAFGIEFGCRRVEHESSEETHQEPR